MCGAKTSKYRGCNDRPNQVELLKMAFDASERPGPGGLPWPLPVTVNDQGASAFIIAVNPELAE